LKKLEIDFMDGNNFEIGMKELRIPQTLKHFSLRCNGTIIKTSSCPNFFQDFSNILKLEEVDLYFDSIQNLDTLDSFFGFVNRKEFRKFSFSL
jgi:hypothetical protein